MTQRRADALREIVEEEIATGRLAPGTRLDEVKLAARFAVSRTPIREALQQLAASGLVELKPRRGAFVTPVGLDQLVQMFETMAEFEASCARLAARRMSEQERQLLCDAHAACGAAARDNTPDTYYHRNIDFHEVIYRGCHNGFLADEVRRLRRRLQAYRRLQLRVRHRMANSLAEHSHIVEALLAGDEATAAEAVRAHVMVQGERFNDLMAELAAG